jgi:hypothetical protein
MKYAVKLVDGHTADATSNVDGYLGNVFGDGKIATYTRGEAIKKAQMFKGKIEPRDVLPETRKYYLVPSEIIESNFPDDMDIMRKLTFEVNTELTPDELKEWAASL